MVGGGDQLDKGIWNEYSMGIKLLLNLNLTKTLGNSTIFFLYIFYNC